MPTKTNDPLVTQSYLKKILDERFDEFEEKIDKKFDRKFDKKFKEAEVKLKKFITKEIDIKGKELKFDLYRRIDEKFEQAETIASERHNQLMSLFDDLAGEVKSSREERIIAGKQISDNTYRIEKLEHTVFKY